MPEHDNGTVTITHHDNIKTTVKNHIEAICEFSNPDRDNILLGKFLTRTEAKLVAKKQGWDEADNVKYYLVTEERNERQITL